MASGPARDDGRAGEVHAKQQGRTYASTASTAWTWRRHRLPQQLLRLRQPAPREKPQGKGLDESHWVRHHPGCPARGAFVCYQRTDGFTMPRHMTPEAAAIIAAAEAAGQTRQDAD